MMRKNKAAHIRLDTFMARQGMVSSRSQAESYIKLGKVMVNGEITKKPGTYISRNHNVTLTSSDTYVSRAAFKLNSVVRHLGVSFEGASVLDVGSSTGGFTDYALQHGALRVVAVDVGTEQMDARIRVDPRVELHEQTDIRDFCSKEVFTHIVVDVSFISIRNIIQAICKLATKDTSIVLMAKPQFEAASKDQLNRGIVKNNAIRRQILQSFEHDIKKYVKIIKSADSKIAGEKGNIERFYMCKTIIQ